MVRGQLYSEGELNQTVRKFLPPGQENLFLMQGLGHQWKASCRAISWVVGQAMGKEDAQSFLSIILRERNILPHVIAGISGE